MILRNLDDISYVMNLRVTFITSYVHENHGQVYDEGFIEWLVAFLSMKSVFSEIGLSRPRRKRRIWVNFPCLNCKKFIHNMLHIIESQSLSIGPYAGAFSYSVVYFQNFFEKIRKNKVFIPSGYCQEVRKKKERSL